MHEDQLGTADANDVARLQQLIPHNPLSPNHGAVATVEIAKNPLPAGEEDFDMVSAATIIFEDDLVGRRATDRRRLSGDEPEDVAPFSSFANDEISQFRHGRSALFGREKDSLYLILGRAVSARCGEAEFRRKEYIPSSSSAKRNELRWKHAAVPQNGVEFSCFRGLHRIG